jgi:hypothetical protein
MKSTETRYVAFLDGGAGAYGVGAPLSPDAPPWGRRSRTRCAIAEAVWDWVEDGRAPAARRRRRLVRRTACGAGADVAAALAGGAAILIVPLIRETGRPAKANLSIDQGLLTAIDEATAARGMTRSAFIAAAARAKITADR